jgi:hypothetical protein
MKQSKKPVASSDGCLDVATAAARLGVSGRYLYQLIKKKKAEGIVKQRGDGSLRCATYLSIDECLRLADALRATRKNLANKKKAKR